MSTCSAILECLWWYPNIYLFFQLQNGDGELMHYSQTVQYTKEESTYLEEQNTKTENQNFNQQSVVWNSFIFLSTQTKLYNMFTQSLK